LQLIREKVKPVYTPKFALDSSSLSSFKADNRRLPSAFLAHEFSIVRVCASIINKPDPISLSSSPTTLRHLAGASRKVIHGSAHTQREHKLLLCVCSIEPLPPEMDQRERDLTNLPNYRESNVMKDKRSLPAMLLLPHCTGAKLGARSYL